MPSAPLRTCPLCSVATPEKICPHDGTPTYVKVVEAPGLEPGIVIGDRYRIVSRIGQGGFGAVYRAVHVATRQDIAIKVLKRELAQDAAQVQRFHAEAQASSLLQQAHTVRVYDFGQIDDGSLYLAMEFLHGRPLEALLHDTPALPPQRAVRILSQVLASLSEAHERGIVHRDLKPDNIFIVDMHGETDWVKVIDFGIAKFTGDMEQTLTRTGVAIGTPRYMSPEQACAAKVDGRSDLYSLGIIAYRLLTGSLPFDGQNSMEIVIAQMHAPPRPIAEVTPQPLPRSLVQAIERVLAKKPDDRFRNADEMRDALESALGDPWMIEPAADTVSPYRGGTVTAYSPAGSPAAPSQPRMEARTATPEPKGFTLLTPASKPGIPAVAPGTTSRPSRSGSMPVSGGAAGVPPRPSSKRYTAAVAIASVVTIAILGTALFLARAMWFHSRTPPTAPAATSVRSERAVAAPPPKAAAPARNAAVVDPPQPATVDASASAPAPAKNLAPAANPPVVPHPAAARSGPKAPSAHHPAASRPKLREERTPPKKGPSNDFQPFN